VGRIFVGGQILLRSGAAVRLSRRVRLLATCFEVSGQSLRLSRKCCGGFDTVDDFHRQRGRRRRRRDRSRVPRRRFRAKPRRSAPDALNARVDIKYQDICFAGGCQQYIAKVSIPSNPHRVLKRIKSSEDKS